MKKIKYYNVIFPLWLIVMFPVPSYITGLCVCSNALIDYGVLYLGMRKNQLTLDKKTKWWTWFKVFVTGWVVDFVVALILLGVSLLLPAKVTYAIHYNPFDHFLGLLIVVLAIVIAGMLIVRINWKWSFKKLAWNDEEKRKVALILGIMTAPYLFLLPTRWLF